jgi:fatty acid desaturase
MSLPFELRDPTAAPTYADGPISRFSKRVLFEARDEVFVRLTLRIIPTMVLLMTGLFLAVHDPHLPNVAKLGVMALYLALWGYLLPPVILMLHNTMHRPFIKAPKWLGLVHPYVMSFFLGIPTGYREHHLGMHHAEDNMQKDLSSTLEYQRDSFASFLAYFFRFFFFGIVEVTGYLAHAKKAKMARRLVFGELAHFALFAAVLALDVRFGLTAFVVPYLICKFMMMVGNWGQHAFINTGAKNSGMSNAITCINSTYNARCFNDGYHIGHHLRANRHWTELPGELEKNIETYIREGCIVFEGIDFFMVSVLLWTGQWKVLARRFVRLDGKERSDDDVIAMLKSRVQRVEVWPAESIGVEVASA